MGPTLVGERLRVHEHLDLRLEHLRVLDHVLGVFRSDHPVAPLEDLVTVFARHADELGDDVEGKLGCDIDHEVAIVLRERFVEDVVGELTDVGLELPDHPGREAAIDQLAIPSVIRGIHHQHHPAAGFFGLGLHHALFLEPYDTAA